MRTFEQLGEVIDWLEELHQRMAALYLQHGREIADRRAGLLLKETGRRVKALAEALGSWRDEADHNTLEAYFQYVIQDNDLALFDSIDLHAEMSADDVADVVIKSISNLSLLYRRLSEMADFEAGAEIFTRLAERSESERDQITTNLQQIKDM
jgi:hypothetical protein